MSGQAIEAGIPWRYANEFRTLLKNTEVEKVAQYRSYLLRLWREKEAIEILAWHGEIESIQSGQKWEFDSLETFVVFLRSQGFTELANEPFQETERSGWQGQRDKTARHGDTK